MGLSTTRCPTRRKCTHFDDKANRVNTLHRYLDLESDSLTFHVSVPIINVIIVDLFFPLDEVLIDFDDDDVGGAAAAKAKEKTLALKLFVKDVVNVKEDEYVVTIKGTMRYELAMDHVSTGMSFRQVVTAMQHTKECSSLSKLGGINDTIVGQYVCVGIAFALQRIVDLCVDESIWALSLVDDGNTRCDQHFFNLHLRVCYRSVLLNLHLVAIPQFDHHTALNTFNMLVKFLDALYGLWRCKLINVGTDGERTMVGSLNGLMTCMAREAEHHVLRIWCPPHQMDVIVKDNAEMLYDGEWSKQYRCTIVQHMTANANDKLSSDQWWVIAYAIAPAIEEINKTFVMSQSHSLLIVQQESLIQMFIGILVAMFGIIHADDGDEFEMFEQWRIERAELVLYVKDQGSFPKLCYERLDALAQKEVMSQLARYSMFILIGLGNICAERDENNEPLK
ncbi:unnamed protein product [Sphagnum jensenii]|uniref:Transposase n=1 Tax=Sphagnum jensenii TaxID=128206 RepID=A0ABP0X8Z5_9BRYO